MPVSPWRTRGVAASVVASALSTVAVVLLARTLPQRVPTHTGHRGTVDAWSSPTGWAWTTVPVVTIIPLASLAFVILVSNLREGFHLRDKHAQAYWTEESHWPEARRRLADTSGWFFAAFSVLMVAVLYVGARSVEWSLPGNTVLVLSLAGVLALTAWFVLRLRHTFRIPRHGGRPRGIARPS